ncbi:MAG: hypothetical protein V4608_12400 [Bacteroidota bacterium]
MKISKFQNLNLCFKYVLLLCFTLVSIVSIAQDDIITSEPIVIEESIPRDKVYYLFSPRVSITVPHPMGNSAFKKTFVGIYEANAGFNLMLYKGVFGGVTFKNALLKITDNKIPNYGNGSMSIYSAAVKAGSDFYISDKNNLIFSASIAAGQNTTKYSSIICKNPVNHPLTTDFKAFYAEPELDLYFIIEENFGVGLSVTYSIIQHTFDPYELCLNEWSQYSKTNTGSTQYLSFGFGFYYGIARRG